MKPLKAMLGSGKAFALDFSVLSTGTRKHESRQQKGPGVLRNTNVSVTGTQQREEHTIEMETRSPRPDHRGPILFLPFSEG